MRGPAEALGACAVSRRVPAPPPRCGWSPVGEIGRAPSDPPWRNGQHRGPGSGAGYPGNGPRARASCCLALGMREEDFTGIFVAHLCSLGKWLLDTSVEILQKVLENVLQTTKIVEEQLDAGIQKLDQMGDELECLKQRRLEALKKAQQQKQEWLSKGHGEYREIPSERDFFQEVKESKNVVCHFYRDTTFRCQIMDKHLTVLAKKHIETKFLKLNAEKSPFLCERLRIKVIPTLALVKDGKTQDYVVGFTDLGNTDDFTTETLEWRLGCADVINYSGNLMDPPFQSQKKFGTFTKLDKKTIRGKKYDSDSDDDD
ncbi:LOW QUALITY PROTEIN: thioredoxin domain-containing protein 9 [Pterocles gutturalis]